MNIWNCQRIHKHGVNKAFASFHSELQAVARVTGEMVGRQQANLLHKSETICLSTTVYASL